MVKCINSKLIMMLHYETAKLSVFVHYQNLMLGLIGSSICFYSPGTF